MKSRHTVCPCCGRVNTIQERNVAFVYYDIDGFEPDGSIQYGPSETDFESAREPKPDEGTPFFCKACGGDVAELITFTVDLQSGETSPALHQCVVCGAVSVAKEGQQAEETICGKCGHPNKKFLPAAQLA